MDQGGTLWISVDMLVFLSTSSRPLTCGRYMCCCLGYAGLKKKKKKKATLTDTYLTIICETSAHQRNVGEEDGEKRRMERRVAALSGWLLQRQEEVGEGCRDDRAFHRFLLLNSHMSSTHTGGRSLVHREAINGSCSSVMVYRCTRPLPHRSSTCTPAPHLRPSVPDTNVSDWCALGG